MRRTLTSASTVLFLALVTSCGNAPSNSAADAHQPAHGGQFTGKPLTARAVFQRLSTSVPTANLTGTVTPQNDPNHLLGRPHEYTSKVTFSDSWVPAAQVTGADPGGVERGGAVEVFANPADARARAQYVRGVTKSVPSLAEYDYVRGPLLVRVSHYLTPEQAATYESAAGTLG
jgi:hypothetical protein